MSLQIDDAYNIIDILNRCETDQDFRKLLEQELADMGIYRKLGPRVCALIKKGVWSSLEASLNYSLSDSGDTIEDIYIDKYNDTETIAMENLMKEDIYKALKKLPITERAIIILSFGMYGRNQKSIEELAESFSVTEPEVIRLKESALKKLKRYMSNETVITDTQGAIALLLAIYWGRVY